MTEMKKLKKILKKELKIKDHVPYKMYDCELRLNKAKNEWLKETFVEWIDTPYFLTGLFNLTRLLPEGTLIEELKETIRLAESRANFDINYYVPGEKYYAKKVYNDTTIWAECVLSIYTEEKCINMGMKQNPKEFISLSNLRRYLIDHPNQHCWPGFCFTDKALHKRLIKAGLMNKPNLEERSYMA